MVVIYLCSEKIGDTKIFHHFLVDGKIICRHHLKCPHIAYPKYMKNASISFLWYMIEKNLLKQL